MTMLRFSAIATLAFLFGCGVAVVPGPNAKGRILPDSGTIIQEDGGVTIAARVDRLEVAPYRMIDNVTSFQVEIRNDTAGEVEFPLSAFLLFDGEGNQYRPIEPAKVQEIVGRDSQYLIPYPYVGYYYLEDQAKSAAYNTFDSSLPYYAENYPQDLYTEALPAGTILPGAQLTGDLYFVIDLATKNRVTLKVFRPGTSTAGPADFEFPFSIEK